MSRSSLIKLLWGENRGLNILILALLLANLSVYIVQTRFLDSELSRLNSEVRDRHQSLRNLQQQKNAGSMPVSELAQAENDLIRFQKLIPSDEELSEMIGEIYKFAANAGLAIKQISYNPEWLEEVALLRYDLKFSVSGQYGQLKRFIHQLERAERILIISDISMTRSAGSQEEGEVSLQIDIKTFFEDESR